MKKENIALLKLIKGHVWLLAGPQNKNCRRELIEDLTGEKTTLAKSGITVLEKLMIQEAKIDTAGKCTVEIFDELEKWVTEL